MKELLPFILFLVIVGGVNALRWLIEKQQREKEKEEPAQRGAEPPARTASPGHRPIFYGRSGQRQPPPAPQVEGETEVRPAPQPLAAPTQAPAQPRRVQSQRTARRPAPVAAAPRPVQAHPLRSEPPQRSSLRKEPSVAPAIPAAVVSEPRHQARFFGDLLAPRNLARAVVLAEILGPPKAFQDL